MSCCKNDNKYNKVDGVSCPLCKALGNNIHYLAVQEVVKEDVLSQVIHEHYFVCDNSDCDVVFFNEDNDRIFLIQDINLSADFKEIIKPKCGSNKSCGGCHK